MVSDRTSLKPIHWNYGFEPEALPVGQMMTDDDTWTVMLWAQNPSFAIGACGDGRSTTGQGRWRRQHRGYFAVCKWRCWRDSMGFIVVLRILQMRDPKNLQTAECYWIIFIKYHIIIEFTVLLGSEEANAGIRKEFVSRYCKYQWPKPSVLCTTTYNNKNTKVQHHRRSPTSCCRKKSMLFPRHWRCTWLYVAMKPLAWGLHHWSFHSSKFAFRAGS